MAIVPVGSNALTKPQMINFVHDVKELEVKAFTLEQTAQQLREEADKIEENANRLIPQAERKRDQQKKEVDAARENRKDWTRKRYCKEYRNKYNPMKKHHKALCIIYWLLSLIATITLMRVSWSSDGALVAVYGTPIISIIVYYIIVWMATQPQLVKTYPQKVNELEEKIRAEEKLLQDAEAAIGIAAKERGNELAKVDALRTHADELVTKANEIHEQLDKLYALNVVPPSYRRLICVVLIDDVFANDKADTMREAVLLCDKEIKHTEVMEAFRDLAEAMRGIRSTLESINRNISMMSQDVYQMVELQWQQLSETQSARYATEAVQESVESLRRWGEIKFNN